jgi:nitrite reductase (NADH) small subunit
MKEVCKLNDITMNTGVAVLIDNKQIALFKVAHDEIYAIDNTDPFSGSNVLSRGIIGESQGDLFVASPIYKQRFKIETGECLDDNSVKLNVYPVDIKDDVVYLSTKKN